MAHTATPGMVTAHAATPGISTGSPPVFYDTEDTHHPESTTSLGFWLYLMSDALIFSMLFATYGVLSRRYAAGPSPKDLFDLPLVALNTALLLFSSITFGMAMLEVQKKRMGLLLFWLVITGLFGLGFLCIELYEFGHMIHEGAGPQRSAFLSSFFTLVGTHGLHVTFGLVWLVTLLFQLPMHGLGPDNKRRLLCLGMFWHFLDVIWIGVFSFVYLIGVLLA